jgi:hypothetical protein
MQVGGSKPTALLISCLKPKKVLKHERADDAGVDLVNRVNGEREGSG